jgi:hypothetical protein
MLSFGPGCAATSAILLLKNTFRAILLFEWSLQCVSLLNRLVFVAAKPAASSPACLLCLEVLPLADIPRICGCHLQTFSLAAAVNSVRFYPT